MKLLNYLYHNIRSYKIVRENVFKRDKYEDRNVLERIIFPYVLAYFNPQKTLDIGREDYQIFYNEFFKNRELWTMDIDPDREEFGMPGYHITDDVKNIKKHFKDNQFDFILMNGVLGWGLDTKENIEKTFSGICDILNDNGILIIGWNQFEDIEVVKPQTIESLKKLKPYYFKPLKGTTFKCINGEHTYNFYTKE